MLAASGLVRASAPSPLAPRVHVRWADGVSDGRRAEVEQFFGLVDGRHREGTTWEYTLVELEPSTVLALVHHPAVVDTHYVDRMTGVIAANAPRGARRLAQRGAAAWIQTPLFNLFQAFWLSSLVVSGLWLVSYERRSGIVTDTD